MTVPVHFVQYGHIVCGADVAHIVWTGDRAQVTCKKCLALPECSMRPTPDTIDTEHKDAPVCPHCGECQRLRGWMQDRTEELRCAECKKMFVCKTYVTTTYTTRKT